MSEEKKNGKLVENLFKIPFFKKLKSIKHIEVIICIIFISLLLLIYFYGFNNDKTTTKVQATTNTNEALYTSSSEFIKEIETKLIRVIGSLKGVSNVSVLVTVSSGGEAVIASSTTETEKTERDESKNVTTTTTPIIVTEDGVSKPIVLTEILPKIKGVIVVAKGADDIGVRLNIYKVIETITDISSENIQVFAGK